MGEVTGDTEAIRAARDEAAIVARGILNVKGSGDAAVAALGRLVARLEAAERERDEEREKRWDAVNQMVAARAAYRSVCTALAAATPDESEAE